MKPLYALTAGFRALCSALVLLVLTGVAMAAPELPALSGQVVDQAGLLDAGQEAALVTRLQALETETSNQMVVVTVPDLQGYDIAEFALELGRQWGIGQEDKNNGLVLLVAPTERKVRFEVGYGLEGFMTDATSSYIIQKEILPAFKEGNFPKGINNGVDAAIGTMNGSYTPDLSKSKDDMGFVPMIMIALIGISQVVGRAFKSDFGGRVMFGGVAGMMVFMITQMVLYGAIAAAVVFGITFLTGMGGGSGGTGGRSVGRGGFGHSTGGSFGGGSFGGGGGSFGGGGASGGW